MIRVKRKSTKALKFSSRQPVVVAPIFSESLGVKVTNVIMNFVIDPVLALRLGASSVGIEVVRNKYVRPTVIDGYTENGDAASRIRETSQINESANSAYRSGVIYRTSVSVSTLIQANMPSILDVDINDPIAVSTAYPVKQVLLTRKALQPSDARDSAGVPMTSDFIFAGQEQLFNIENSTRTLSPNSSRLRSIANNDESLSSGVFIANCSRIPFPIQSLHRDNKDEKVSQYGDIVLEQQAAFLESIDISSLSVEPRVRNPSSISPARPTAFTSVNVPSPGSDVDVYNEFSGVSATSESLFLINKKIKRFEFGTIFAVASPGELKNFTIIVNVRNEQGVVLQSLEKDVDAAKMIRAVTSPITQPSIAAVSANTNDLGDFVINCIVERKDTLNEKVRILTQEPGGKFELLTDFRLNLNEPFEFQIIPESSSGFMRVRAITISSGLQTSQQYSEIAVKIGESFELIDAQPELQQMAGKILTVNLRDRVRSSSDGKYDVSIDAVPPKIARQISKLGFDRLLMRRINVADGENPGDPTSGTKEIGPGFKFEGTPEDSFSDKVDAGSYIYVFDGVSVEDGFVRNGIASIPVTIPEGFVSEPGGKKSGSDGTVIASSADVSITSGGISGIISIRPEFDDVSVKKSEVGVVLQGVEDFSKQAEIKVEEYIQDITLKDDGTIEVRFDVPKDDIPEDVKDVDGALVSLFASPSFEYEKSQAKSGDIAKTSIVTEFGEPK